jgi:hypothetical protein
MVGADGLGHFLGTTFQHAFGFSGDSDFLLRLGELAGQGEGQETEKSGLSEVSSRILFFFKHILPLKSMHGRTLVYA